MYLATYDNLRRLRVYQITVKWDTSDDPPDSAPKIHNPIIDALLIAEEEYCSPYPHNSTDHDAVNGPAFSGHPNLSLTHLDFVPQMQTAPSKPVLPATIIAVFSPVSPSSPIVMDHTSQYHSSNSTVCRWIIKDGRETRLLPVFDEIAVKIKSVGSVEARVK